MLLNKLVNIASQSEKKLPFQINVIVELKLLALGEEDKV